MDAERLWQGRWERLHPGRNFTKADVYRVEIDDRVYAAKDYRRCHPLVRLTIGRWSLRREERAYRALDGLPGIPRCAGRLDPLVLVTRLVEGTSLSDWGAGRPLPENFFARLKELLDGVHSRGVVQGDLHHRDVLVGDDGRPWLVDFSTSLIGGPRGGLWRLLARLDRRSVLKLQERFLPGTLTAQEEREMREPPRIYRWARRLRGRR